MSVDLVQELDYRDFSSDGSDSEVEGSETQMPEDVTPLYVTEHMSVENVILYLKKNSIPDKYCEVFKGKSKICGN